MTSVPGASGSPAEGWLGELRAWGQQNHQTESLLNADMLPGRLSQAEPGLSKEQQVIIYQWLRQAVTPPPRASKGQS